MKANVGDSYIPIKHPLLMLGSVMLGTLIISIDTTIANVALPHMQGSLSATQDQISWVLTSYIVATAIMIPPTGFLAGKLGPQRLMIFCITGFLIASMLCGTATSLAEMVLFRMLQGACGAAISPLGQSLVMDHFPAQKRGQILALWGMGVMVGPIIGPTLGGYLTEALSWRWVFYINVPLCVLALIGIVASVPRERAAKLEPFDFLGFGLISVCIGAFQLVLDRGHSVNWFQSTEIVVEAAVAALCLYLFLVHMFTAKHPFIEPRLFRDKNLLSGLLLIGVSQAVIIGQMALLPNLLQQLMQIPVDTTGLLMMPRGIASIISMGIVSRFINRVDARQMMAFGLLLLCLSMYEMSRINLDVSQRTIVLIGFLQGFAISFLVAPMTTATFATLTTETRAEGAALYSLMRNLGGSIGVAMIFTGIAKGTQANHQYLGANITAFSTSDALPAVWRWNTEAGAMALNSELTRQAASIAYFNIYWFLAASLFLMIPLCFLFSNPNKILLRQTSHAFEHAE